MESLLQDLRFSLRGLARNPGFTATIVMTFALGIGANTALFSVINALLLRTLPVRDPRQLVALSDPESRGMGIGISTGVRDLFSYHEFEGLRDSNQTFSGIFAMSSQLWTEPVSLGGSDEAGRAAIRMVSGGYFPVLGVQPQLGHTFGAEVDQGLGAHPQAVISYAFWQRRMQQDPAILQRKLRIRQTVFDIIGVMPPDFTGIVIGDAPEIWVPLTMQQSLTPGRDFLTWQPGSVTKIIFLHVVGRLKPDTSLSQASASINVTFKQSIEAEAGTIADEKDRKALLDVRIVLRDARHGLSVLRSQYARPLAVLMGMVGLLLLLACANVANLLLARATGRQRELAVRVALGANRRRLLRQLLTESILLSTLGACVGSLLAIWADRLLLQMVSAESTPVPLDVHLDFTVLGFTLGATILTGVLFGLAPALRATRLDLNQVLRGATRSIASSDRGTGRLHLGKWLVGVQVAISLLLLVTAGLFVRSLQKLTSVPLGYDAGHLILFRLDATPSGYKGPALTQLNQDLLQKFAAAPGVRSVSLSENGLFFSSESRDQISILGFTPKSGQEMHAFFDRVGSRYFSTIGIPVLLGRDVSEQDSTGDRHCWVNQTMARYYFGDASPLGQRIRDEYPETRIECEIVGVVADAKYNRLRGETPRRFYFAYFNGLPDPERPTFEVRYTGDSAATASALRQIVRATDSTLDPLDIRTIHGQLDRGLLRDRLTARLSSFFGLVALLLACVGLYGILSYNVARRTGEIGVRMALGAQRADVLWLVLREATLVTVLGVVVGLAAAWAATRVLESLLYGLTARDPATMVGAAVVLLAVAALAAVIPAWRATRVDPMTALRYE